VRLGSPGCAPQVLDRERLREDNMLQQIRREIAILRDLHHPYVVDLKEVMGSRDKIYMVLECAPARATPRPGPQPGQHRRRRAPPGAGSCRAASCSTRSCPRAPWTCAPRPVRPGRPAGGAPARGPSAGGACAQEAVARKVFQQMLDGLDYCHRRGIFHRCRACLICITWFACRRSDWPIAGSARGGGRGR